MLREVFVLVLITSKFMYVLTRILYFIFFYKGDCCWTLDFEKVSRCYVENLTPEQTDIPPIGQPQDICIMILSFYYYVK